MTDMRRQAALFLAGIFLAGGLSGGLLTGCRKADTQKPAADAPASADASPSDAGAADAARKAALDGPGPEVTFTRVPQIYKTGKPEAIGKLAQIMLRFHTRAQPDWVIMMAVDGSYQIAFLTFDDRFLPVIDGMTKGTPYLVDFIVTDITSGGAPRGKITAINNEAPPDTEFANPLAEPVQRIEEVKNLPEDVRRERRMEMRKMLHKQADVIEPLIEQRIQERKAGEGE